MDAGDLVVIKFGGTALGTAGRVQRAAERVRRLRQSGRHVVVVVSAAGTATDRLVARAAAVGLNRATNVATHPRHPEMPVAPDPAGRERDRALATGEELSAALLAGALLAAGVPARSVRGGEAGLRARGPHGAGVLEALEADVPGRLLAGGWVPVIAGFQAADRAGETLTLGRGASDLSAVFLACALRAAECHIVTDVDGVYDRDPRRHADARRHPRLDHAELVRLTESGAGVVHARAARLAAERRLPLRIYHHRAATATPGGTTVTTVAAAADGRAAGGVTGGADGGAAGGAAAPPPLNPAGTPVRIAVATVTERGRTVTVALAGCGVVGGAFERLLAARRAAIAARHGIRFELARVLVRRADVPRSIDAALLTADVDVLLAAHADVVVEALGGVEPAGRIARCTLARGARLVTANKSLVAREGGQLAALAAAQGGTFDFEAAVGGGIPIVRALRDALAQAPIRRIQGIVNGTSNFVLSRMEQGDSFTDAVARAQRLGYAEADPSRDLDGTDAAEKTAILAWLAFGVPPHEMRVRRRGIAHDADALVATAHAAGGRLRLLAECTLTPTGVVAGVAPAVVPADSGFGRTDGVENRITIDLGWDGELALTGPGAGAEPTAAALLGDVLRACTPITAGAAAQPAGTVAAAARVVRAAQRVVA